MKHDTYGVYLINYSFRYANIILIPINVVAIDVFIAIGSMVMIATIKIYLFCGMLFFKVRRNRVTWELHPSIKLT